MAVFLAAAAALSAAGFGRLDMMVMDARVRGCVWMCVERKLNVCWTGEDEETEREGVSRADEVGGRCCIGQSTSREGSIFQVFGCRGGGAVSDRDGKRGEVEGENGKMDLSGGPRPKRSTERIWYRWQH